MRQGGGYRRGAVAGLSLGEVFILLSFVLVLAVLLIDDEMQREVQQGHLGVPDAAGATPPDPNKIQTLSAEAESLRSELAKLSEELAAKDAELKQVGERLGEAENEIANLTDQLSAEKSNRQLTEEKTTEIAMQLQESNAELLQAEKNISALESRVQYETERRSEAEADAALQRTRAESEATARAEAQDELVQIYQNEAIQSAESDDLVSSLESSLTNAEADKNRLTEELTAKESELEQAEKEKSDLAGQLSAEESIRQKAEEDLAELLRNLQELIAELQRNRARLAQAEETISNLEEDLRRETELRHQAEANAELERARADSEAAARAEADERVRGSVSKEEKGENPPCWYVRVEDGQGTREKAIYALDIRVTDNFMMFGDLGLPSGKPDRGEQGDFASEAAALGLSDLPYEEPLDDAQASRHLEKLFDAGKNMTVRSYPCTFFARVWDHTSTDSKARWQSIWEGVIGQYVQPYRVKEDPWPHESRP